MYIPKHYEKSDIAELHALIDARPLATWVAPGDAGIVANHIPFMIDAQRGEFGTLVAHVAKANPVWRDLAQHESIVIFHGPDAYVSPSWYPSKMEHGKVVPTWNYVAVHAHGPVQAIHDHAWLLNLLERLTARHEAGSASPWKVSDAPAEYIARRLDAIVGIEIPIRRLEGKWKLSQKEAAPDRRGIAAGLAAQARPEAVEIARLVETEGARQS